MLIIQLGAQLEIDRTLDGPRLGMATPFPQGAVVGASTQCSLVFAFREHIGSSILGAG